MTFKVKDGIQQGGNTIIDTYTNITAQDFYVNADDTVAIPSLNLDFLSNQRLDPRINYSRLSSGTYIDSKANVATSTSDTPRFEYYGNGSPRGLLIESARTNLLNNHTSGYSIPSTRFTTSNTTGPDGTNTSYIFTVNNTGTLYVFHNTSTDILAIDGTLHTYSAYVKQANSLSVHGTTMAMHAHSQLWNDGLDKKAWFNIVEGTVLEAQTGITASIDKLRDGWCRIAISFAPEKANTGFGCLMYPGNSTVSSLSGTVLGNGTPVFIAWGAQSESGKGVSSFIYTAGSAATRAADNAFISSISSWFNEIEGTFVVQGDCFAASNTGPSVLYTSTGASIANVHALQVFDGALRYVQTSTPATIDLRIDANTSNRFTMAAGYKENNYGFTANGSAANTSSSGTIPTNVTRMGIGMRADGAAQWLNGHIHKIKYYPVKLSNSELTLASK